MTKGLLYEINSFIVHTKNQNQFESARVDNFTSKRYAQQSHQSCQFRVTHIFQRMCCFHRKISLYTAHTPKKKRQINVIFGLKRQIIKTLTKLELVLFE